MSSRKKSRRFPLACKRDKYAPQGKLCMCDACENEKAPCRQHHLRLGTHPRCGVCWAVLKECGSRVYGPGVELQPADLHDFACPHAFHWLPGVVCACFAFTKGAQHLAFHHRAHQFMTEQQITDLGVSIRFKPRVNLGNFLAAAGEILCCECSVTENGVRYCAFHTKWVEDWRACIKEALARIDFLDHETAAKEASVKAEVDVAAFIA